MVLFGHPADICYATSGMASGSTADLVRWASAHRSRYVASTARIPRGRAHERARRSACQPRNRLRVAGIGCLVDRPPVTGWNMTRMPLPTPTLHTARLRLRPFDDADADALF